MDPFAGEGYDVPADKTNCFDQSVAESFEVPGRIIVKPGEELVLEASKD